MHALIVVAHPNRRSLTLSIAQSIAAGVTGAGQGHTVGIADLAAEGFDPRFTSADHAVHDRTGPPPPDVLAEQARLDDADALVLVYPIYWWSMPALLKGWIDRVFSNGWAYDFSPDTGLVKKLNNLNVHLVGIGGADRGTYVRHGYFDAMKKQIEHGIFDFCGALVVHSHFMLETQAEDAIDHHASARAIGHHLFDPPAHAEASKDSDLAQC
jgi:NAD(P)H dehydrogenase (quinone)